VDAGSGTRAVLARVIANRDLRRVLFSYFAFHIAEFGTWVAILLYAYEATGPGSVGMVALLQLVPAALAAAPAATLGDRYPRHRVLTAGYLLQAAAMLLTAAAMLLSWPVPVVYAAATVAATAMIVTRPTQSALLPSLSRTPDELTAANGAAGIVEGFGVLVGPLVAAGVLAVSSAGGVFLVASGALLVAAAATARLRPRQAASARASDVHGRAGATARDDPAGWDDPAAERSKDGFLAGLTTVLGDRDARLIVGLLTARMIVVGAADVLFVLLALGLLDMGEPGAGLLNAALGAGTIAGGALGFALVGRERLAIVALLGSVAWGLAIAVIGLSGAAVLAPGLLVIGGAGLTILEIGGRTILQRSIRDEVLARVFGIQEGLAMAGLAVGAVAVTGLVELTGLVPTVLLVGAFLPLMVGLAWPGLSAIDRRATPPIQALELLRRTSLFAPLPPPQLEAVARRGTWLTLDPGTVVIREGERGDRYYVLGEGSVVVSQSGRAIRRLDRRGDGFGEIALLLDVPRTATIVVEDAAVVFAIERAPFLAAMTGQPQAMAAATSAAVGTSSATSVSPPVAIPDVPVVDASTANPDNLTRN
jgi:MFS family permease